MDDREPNRRRFIKKGVALAGWVAAGGTGFAKGQTASSAASETPAKDLDAYGERSHYVTSARIFPPPWGPDPFGLTSHLFTPLQDSVGIITPASLHYTMAHKGFYVPDINPAQHRLMIHGMVDIR